MVKMSTPVVRCTDDRETANHISFRQNFECFVEISEFGPRAGSADRRPTATQVWLELVKRKAIHVFCHKTWGFCFVVEGKKKGKSTYSGFANHRDQRIAN